MIFKHKFKKIGGVIVISRDEYLKMPLEDRFIKLSGDEEARVEELYKDMLVIDLHTHVLRGEFVDNVPRIQRSRINGFIEAVANIEENFADSMNLLGQYLNMVEKHPDFVPAFCAQDFVRAKESGKQAAMFQLEPQTFGRNLDRIEFAYGLGIRMALLTFNTRTYIGDGCGERTDGGLSYLGFEAVERMNELGMLIDLSHCGVQTTLDAIEASKDPVMCNHVGARALYPQMKRLKTDEALKALADKGGIAGVSAIPNQLSGNAEQGIEDMLNHIDYIVKLIGTDHVALGLDNVFHDQVGYHRQAARTIFKLEYIGQELNAPYMYGIESPEEWPNIIRGLVSRGYSDDEIVKIAGGNALRVIREVVG
jgi:membrane dipeptidase